MKPKVLIIAGATCTGKTSLGIEMAKEFNGEIISADSMQIYSSCNIGTAKIKENEMQGIEHHMLSIISPKQEFSVGEFKELAEKKIHEILEKGKLPILVGGTGLYFEALIKNYDFANTTKNLEVRQKYETFLNKNGKEELHKLLAQKNLEKANQIDLNNTRRVIRALEIEECGNKNECKDNKESEFDFLFCVLLKNREDLYSKINERVEVMFAEGLEEEVKSLLSSGVTFEKQCMQSIGYKEWKEYFENKITMQELKEKIKQNTRRYAKRQLTWFRHREGVIEFCVDNEEFKNNIKNSIKEWLKDE